MRSRNTIWLPPAVGGWTIGLEEVGFWEMHGKKSSPFPPAGKSEAHRDPVSPPAQG